jgi:molybdopterin molybdotransferase
MVHRRPGVALVSTGDELVPIGAAVGPGRITSTNAMMLAAQVARAGGTAHDLGIAPDDPERLTAVLRGAVASHDVLVTTGGASVGDHDLVPHVLESLGCRFVFAGIALRPGKPTAYGQLGHTHVFVLPGNPASALVTFELLVRPALRRLQGVRGDVRPRTLPVRLRNAAPGAGRRAHYVRAQLHGDGSATVLDDQVSGSLGSIRDFDALVVVPVGSVGLTAEATADAIVVDPWWHERRSS